MNDQFRVLLMNMTAMANDDRALMAYEITNQPNQDTSALELHFILIGTIQFLNE